MAPWDSYQAGTSEYLMYVASLLHEQLHEYKRQLTEISPHVETSCMMLTMPPDPVEVIGWLAARKYW